jgi:RimJ/RimL family protein N-acetyltransferase
MLLTIKLKKISRDDWDFILKLRNKKEYRGFFIQQHTISKKEHYQYMTQEENNPNYFCWIILKDSIKIGYVRILDNDVGIAIENKYHGKGYGANALLLLEKEAKKIGLTKLVGRVMIHNESSKKIFLNNDYKLKLHWYEKDL